MCSWRIVFNRVTNKYFHHCLLFSLYCLSYAYSGLKKSALLKGPGNKSRDRLSLLLFFAYGGLTRGKNSASIVKKIINFTFDRRKSFAQWTIFPIKTLRIHLDQHRTQFKRQIFFFHRPKFPAKRLHFFILFHRHLKLNFSRKKT